MQGVKDRQRCDSLTFISAEVRWERNISARLTCELLFFNFSLEGGRGGGAHDKRQENRVLLVPPEQEGTLE